MNDTKQSATSKPFTISRTFDAPRDLVWQAWTQRDQLMRWFGPKGITISHATLDFRPGGLFHYCMKTPDGKEMWGKFVYREIKVPERIVWVNSFSDEKAGIGRHPMNPNWPQEMLSTATFTEERGQTTVSLRWEPISPNEIERATFDSNHQSMTMGWTGTFERLEAFLRKS